MAALSHSYEHAVQFIQILLSKSFLCRKFRKTHIKYVFKTNDYDRCTEVYQNLFNKINTNLISNQDLKGISF